MRMVVDLPAPLGPRKPVTRPGSTAKSMPLTAVLEPNVLVSPRARMPSAGPCVVVMRPRSRDTATPRIGERPWPTPDRTLSLGQAWRRGGPRTVSAAARPPSSASSGVAPSTQRARKPAANASPAPVVSTTSMRGAVIWARSVPPR